MPIEIDPNGLNVADPEASARFDERLLGPPGRVRGRTVMPRPGTERIGTGDRAAGAMQGLTRRAALAWGTALLAPAALSACGGGAPAAEEPGYASLRLPAPVSQHAALALGGLRVAVVGGSRGLSTLSASVDAFDAATGAWSSLALMSTGRSDARAVAVSPTLLFVHGGARSLSASRTAEWVDLTSGLSHPAPVSPSRAYHSATLLRDGRILVAGGLSTEAYPGGVSPTLELWDPVSRGWRLVAQPLQQARQGHTATLLPDGRVLLVGGYTATGMAASAEVFDPRSETTELIPSPLLARAGHAVAPSPDGTVLIAGGEQGVLALPASPAAVRLLGDPWRVEPVPGVPVLGWTRSAFAADGRGRLKLFGGVDPNGRAVSHAVEVDHGLVVLPPMPQGREWHSATVLSTGKVLLLGGEQDGLVLNSALVFG